jgi:hypothetical protein
MTSFYYLFFIYLIPLVFYRRAYLVALLIGLAGWFHYAGTEYVRVLRDVFMMNSMRDGLRVAEDAGLFSYGAKYLFILVPVICFWRRDWKKLVSVAWFALPNQARYLETLIPLLSSYARFWQMRITQTRLLLVTFCILLWNIGSTPRENSYAMLAGIVPAGSRVVSLENETMFKLIYTNDNLRVTPCQDIAWDTPVYRTAKMTALRYGMLAPGFFNPNQYDFLVEKNLTHVPEGFQLYTVSGKYRVWKPLDIKS